MSTSGHIALRGVRVHNLKSIDLDIPHRKLIVFCGLSGSGKSSLALDTLYAEGQRRYIESFSAYTRQFLQRLERPEAERMDGIPPAIAVTGKNTSRSSRSTVGTATETNDYLRLLFAKIGHTFCRNCGREVRCESPQSAADTLRALPPGTRYMIAFSRPAADDGTLEQVTAALREDGFVRAIFDGRLINLEEESPAKPQAADTAVLYVVVDRLTAGGASDSRLRDSLETAFAKGRGRCYALVKDSSGEISGAMGAMENSLGDSLANSLGDSLGTEVPSPLPCPLSPLPSLLIDGKPWRRMGFGSQLICEDCGIEYPPPEPRLYSFNSPMGACPECEGFGNVIGLDMELIVPDAEKSLREGALAPWNTPAYAHELKELLALARDYDIPTDVPFRQLSERQVGLIVHGVPERKFGGLEGFFAWLERRKYKMHIRVFLSRWRSFRVCPACGGTRLRPEALAAQIGGRNIGQIGAMKVRNAAAFFRRLQLPDYELQVGRMMLEQVQARLGYLEAVGLGYLTLDRTLRTLSGGESRRVALDLGARFQPGGNALRARRAVNRAASPRHQPASRRRQAAARAGQHRCRGRARGGDHPGGRSGCRNRSRRGRTRREGGFSGHAQRNGAIARQPHRRLSGGATRAGEQRPTARAQSRLDSLGRRGATI